MSESSEDVEYAYTAWQCTNCGHEVPKNNPPCDRCGNMDFQQVEIREGDFADEIRGPGNLQLLREHALTVGAGVGILLVVAVAVLANAGVFVVADPFGLGYRYGTVDAVQPNDDGHLTAGEFHGRVTSTFDETRLRWDGRDLALSYRTSSNSNGAVAEGITTVATWYATYVHDGGTARGLRITAITPDGTRFRVTIASTDARQFATGEISESEYRSRIFDGTN